MNIVGAKIVRYLAAGWKRIEAAANKRNVSVKIWLPLWLIGSAIFDAGAWVLVTQDFFLGLAIMAGSYFIDYGYIFVAGRPDRKMLIWVGILGLVSVAGLVKRVGLGYAVIAVTTVAFVIAVARMIHNRGKEK